MKITSRLLKRIALAIIGFFVLIGLILISYVLITIHQIENEKYGQFTDYKEITTLKEPKATIVYTADGLELGRFSSDQFVPVKFNDLSKPLVQNFLTYYDPNFYQYKHFDYWGISKGILLNLLGFNFDVALGICWDLTHHPYLFYQRNPNVEANQFVHIMEHYVKAKKLSETISKEEQIAFVLNMQEFGNSIRGIFSASKSYFNKSPKELNWLESAAIIAVTRAPFIYDPKRNPENNARERKAIIFKLLKNEIIDQALCDSLLNTELVIDKNL